jgi:hypothetical protein
MSPVVIFTFDADALAAAVAAASALRAGLGPVFVFEDMAKPVPDGLRREMTAAGCRVRGTAWPRVGNLRGLHTYLGLLDTYVQVFRETGASHLVRLDSDTYIVRPHRLRQAVADDVAAASLVSAGYGFYGCCCVLSARVVAATLAFVTRWGGVPGHDNASLGEDVATGHLARKLGLGEVREWHHCNEGGFCAGYEYHRASVPLSEYAHRFDVITFGNRNLLEGPDCARRDHVAATMLEFHRGLTAH